jgi:type IV pilus assembly protein PilA
MQCPHCGAEAIPGNRFCGQCRKRIVPPAEGQAVPPPAPPYGHAASPPVDLRRPGGITVIAVLDIIGGSFLLLGGMGSFLVGLSGDREAAVGIIAGLVYLVLGGGLLAAAIGLLRLKEWARMTRVVLSCIGLIGFPCGTVISVVILIYLLKPGIKVLFSGRSAAQLTPQEARDVVAATQGSAVLVVAVAAVAVLFGVAMIGIIAAIAIPSLLRARIAANEASAIGDLRTVVSAEVTYQSANGGRYGTLECLARPSACLTGYAGAAFVDPETVGLLKQGYQRRFTLSEDGLHYTFSASPVNPGGTGTRAFCTDETGLICQKPAASRATSDGGTCDTRACTPI